MKRSVKDCNVSSSSSLFEMAIRVGGLKKRKSSVVMANCSVLALWIFSPGCLAMDFAVL
jgi:hypothetical protein